MTFLSELVYDENQQFEKYLSEIQKIVVKERIRLGYKAILLKNGYWLVYKDSHHMVINKLGYDSFVRMQ